MNYDKLTTIVSTIGFFVFTILCLVLAMQVDAELKSIFGTLCVICFLFFFTFLIKSFK